MTGKPQDPIRLKIQLNGQTFEAEGSSDLVIEQLHHFLALAQNCQSENFPPPMKQVSVTETAADSPPRPTLDSVNEGQPFREALDKIIRKDSKSSTLVCSVRPGTSHASQDTAMILLLGHHVLLQQAPTSVLALAKSLKRSGHAVARIDRLLRDPIKHQWILKSGTGKGGKYQLTKSGWDKAGDLALAFAQLLP